MMSETVTLSESKTTRLSLLNTPSNCLTHKSLTSDPTEDDVIQKAFIATKHQWIDDPVISQWRKPEHHVHRVLFEANLFYHQWKTMQQESVGWAPFAAAPYALWHDTGRVLAAAGLPWHNNQVNLPDEIDSSWPFHFKAYESQALQIFGSRVGDSNASGYICNYSEANCYCIRALQQELRKIYPVRRPLLVYDQFDPKLVKAFEKFFGLETHQINLSGTYLDIKEDLLSATSRGSRPVIFAATVGNFDTNSDDLGVIAKLSTRFISFLHVDAFRSFNYITTRSEKDIRWQGMERLGLSLKQPDQPLRADNGTLLATTVVAGGLSDSPHGPAAALKPALLGGKPVRVAYIRAFDSTLGGSRDAIPPLWLSMYEMRLGEQGVRDLCGYLTELRAAVLSVLRFQGISANLRPYCLDVVVRACTVSQKQQLLQLGGLMRSDGDIILAIHPGISVARLASLQCPQVLSLRPMSTKDSFPPHKNFIELFKVPQHRLDEIKTMIQCWRILTPSTAGYPLHMGSYSALGPVIGRFWETEIPQDWMERVSNEILACRLELFGVLNARRQTLFKGGFTNGSTMGNRCAIHTALANIPNGHIYFSTETHYSVAKTLRDCDTLTHRWSGGKPQYSEIPCASDGSILAEALVKQVLLDKKRYTEDGQEFHMILFANIGTTFGGARDNLNDIYQSLNDVGIAISYIHVDGAFDLGFNSCGLKLGAPGAIDATGMPFIQGVTISHHKALGQMVSGEVLCLSPEDQMFVPNSDIDPMIIFETWLYSRIFLADDLALMRSYGLKNAALLEQGLQKIGMATKRNHGSLITVLERPPSWIVEEFSLRPEGDWVHFITMPHISKDTVEYFVSRILSIDHACSAAFGCVAPVLGDIIGRPIKLKRIQCRGILADRVYELVPVLKPTASAASTSPNSLGLTIKSSIRGALSVAAVDEQGSVHIVIVVESIRDQSIRIGPLLVKAELLPNGPAIIEIARQLLGLMTRYLKATTTVTSASYGIYGF